MVILATALATGWWCWRWLLASSVRDIYLPIEWEIKLIKIMLAIKYIV